MILRHTAIPYFDQANYISRIYFIREAVGRDGYWHPDAYLAGVYSTRPPLMMVPAVLLWGHTAHPRPVALLWLGLRMATLLLALWIFSRVLSSTAFVPLALLVVLGGAFYLQVVPQLYLMDQTFGVFALLATACLLWELKRPSAKSALGLGTSLLMLLLIKPAGLIFALPVLAIAGLRGVIWAGSNLRQRDVARVFPWAAAWIAFFAGLGYLLLSPYWYSALDLWKTSWQGWWNFPRNAARFWQMAVLMIPGWLALLVVWATARRGTEPPSGPAGAAPPSRGITGWMLAAAMTLTAWWYFYNVWLSFSNDQRFPASFLPVGVTFAAILVCSNRRLARAALLVASLLFAGNLAIASGLGRPTALQILQPLTGALARAEHPVAEVGLVNLCRGMQEQMLQTGDTSGPVCVLIVDEYIDHSSLTLAMRYVNGDQWSPIRFEQVPWGSTALDVAKTCQARWFLTKRPRSTITLAGDPFVRLSALEHLLTNTESPLATKLEKVAEYTLRQPDRVVGDYFRPDTPWSLSRQTVTLWRLREPITQLDTDRAQQWLKDRGFLKPPEAATSP
ncbi:MAG: hypothetical protein V1750_00175 [Acidobacteriota bacterium]